MKENMENKIKEYKQAMNLANKMFCYEMNIVPSDKINEMMSPEVSKLEMTLPSKKIGNVIALALELNYYNSAEYLINHSDEYKLKKDYIAKDIQKERRKTSHYELLYSMFTYIKKPEEMDAFERLKNKLNISSKELYQIKEIEKNKKNRLKIAEITSNKRSFEAAMHVSNIMEQFENNKLSKEKLNILSMLYSNMIFPLPSGKKGNVLSLAFELNNYKVADYLLNQSEEYQIKGTDKENEQNGLNIRQIRDEFINSLTTFEERLNNRINNYYNGLNGKIVPKELRENVDKIKRTYKEEIKAIRRIQEKINIKKENINNDIYMKIKNINELKSEEE